MATSPPATSHPAPAPKSPTSPTLDLAHPTPDLQSLQGAYIGNVERLEERAERMSSNGSDIAEEIRKLQLEQKLSDSRKSSLRSGPPDDGRPQPTGRSRNASTSSFTHSIVDVNNAARWGGYSPGGYVTSPVGSLHSGSFSFSQPSIQRQRSGSRASRLGQFIHTEEDEDAEIHDVQPQSPQSPQSAQPVPRDSPPPPSHRSVSSFTKRYDQIAQEIQDEFHHIPEEMYDVHEEHEEQPRNLQIHVPHDLPDRPATAASTDTYHQARTLFHDFDGVHCDSTIEEEEPQSAGSRNSSMLKAVQHSEPQGIPPPEDGMVFYPAPVPRMLNLPKRLSQMPSAAVQARRRTQLLESMQNEKRKSAAGLLDEVRTSEDSGEGSKHNRKSMDPRKSRKSFAGLPPQLRASAYFDQAAPTQEFEVKGESAEDTLDSILAASAHAPVSAFTDHPIAGHVGKEVYGREQHRKSTAALVQDKSDDKKRRSSMNILSTRRNSNGDPLNKLKKRSSSQDLNQIMAQRSSSRLSLGTELEGEQGEIQDHAIGENITPVGQSVEEQRDYNEEAIEDEEAESEPEQEEEQQFFGPPTTLLAELQMRKAQQKSRNKTAATAFPNGMHSTLLELDAVAEIERKKRQKHKVALAWEAPVDGPEDEEDSDDDVPLGVLFPGRDGLANKKKAAAQDADWNRPLGLIAQRELEDNEPLSRRRNRLLGLDPSRQRDVSPNKRATLGLPPSASQPTLNVPALAVNQEEEEDEGETLAQRMRRLKNKEALDSALGDVRKSVISNDFASEMLSQFGPTEEKSPPVEEEEETLGQRKKRLQAEALARGANPDAPANNTRPPLRASHSMADILAAHPVDKENDYTARKVSNEQLLSSLPQGSLLQKNEEKRSRQRAGMLDANRRISSYNLEKPLLDIEKSTPEPAVAAKIEAYKGGMYNNGMGGAGTPATAPVQNPSMMLSPQMMGGMNMMTPGQRDSYFPQGNPMAMGMGMGMGMPMNGMNNFNQMMPQQMMAMNMGMGMGMPMMGGMQGMGYPQMGGMSGMRQSSMGSMGMGMQSQSMIEPPMDPRQRDMIDRWRQSVMPS